MSEQADEIFLKRCAGKIQHRTYLSAEYYYNENNSKPEAEIYHCDDCGFYHIGTLKKESKNLPPKKLKHKLDKDEHKPKIRKFKY